ncbi:NTP transferase domain-containing protein [Xylanimonas ulmi]|uniref:CTP:phosphocholine cytidylyltransferase-like protein n=1 Tax=Xylanimonas ulmi TaxID=228973 RepID=A0A4Q7LZG9_9MICO|nr:phosphotransferase [Xylanibacterium ulmi]RZS59963.1 CTP:phosphocholine cytidylyltransferase-like protein [Xylanibacterium ulmi]
MNLDRRPLAGPDAGVDPAVLLLRAVGERRTRTASQRKLAVLLGWDRSQVRARVADAVGAGLLVQVDDYVQLSPAGFSFLEPYRVRNAIILAAGTGSRLLPLTFERHKGLTPVRGEPMIERQIRQLHARGVENVVVVTGYLADSLEYLSGRPGVITVHNPEFQDKNNLASLFRAADQLGGTYLLVADNWMDENIFRPWETHSWMWCEHTDDPTPEWIVDTASDGRITDIHIGGAGGWFLAGPAYLTPELAQDFAPLVVDYYHRDGSDDFYWEDVLRRELGSLPPIYAEHASRRVVHEFETVEELRQFDRSYLFDIDDPCLTTISTIFGVPQHEITGFKPIKTGMTNTSFVFAVDGVDYVYRRPGAGTDELISRQDEKRSYEAVAELGISDEIVHFDAASGVKVSRFYEGSAIVDPFNDDQVARSMRLLREFHDAQVTTPHRFDIRERLAAYFDLLEQDDLDKARELKPYMRQAARLDGVRVGLGVPEVLCHIDYVFANILTLPSGEMRVIDWEYSGAADPLIDVAMFSIYALYDRAHIDRALEHYLGRSATVEEALRVYLHVALAGLLWSLWAYFKAARGETFGEYPEQMLQYFTAYYRIITSEGTFDDYIARHHAASPADPPV